MAGLSDKNPRARWALMPMRHLHPLCRCAKPDSSYVSCGRLWTADAQVVVREQDAFAHVDASLKLWLRRSTAL